MIEDKLNPYEPPKEELEKSPNLVKETLKGISIGSLVGFSIYTLPFAIEKFGSHSNFIDVSDEAYFSGRMVVYVTSAALIGGLNYFSRALYELNENGKNKE